MEKSTVIVLFGAAGDLAKKKLYHSIHSLHLKGVNLFVIGSGRREFSQADFHSIVSDASHSTDASFLNRFAYLSGNSADISYYEKLKSEISSIEAKNGKCNVIYYLSIPPELFSEVAVNLKKSGLNKSSTGFRRLVIEKPFGYDLETARKLNSDINNVFSEDQIYRIDHYLGKELVQNIIAFRFTNPVFQGLWNKNHIDNVQITISETAGVDERGNYYDKSGALRDMVQNHILQIMSLVAMEEPKDNKADSIRDEKVKLLNSIEKFDGKNIKNVVSGQYSGYASHTGVAKDSKTETFTAIKFNVNNERFKDVPFYARTGKKMSKSFAEVNIVFKKLPCVFCSVDDEKHHPNVLKIRIQPEEIISLQFNVRKPETNDVVVQNLEFLHEKVYGLRSSKSYEVLINDVISGDMTRFVRWDEVEASWKIIDSITNTWKTAKMIFEYDAGSFGPKEADLLLANSKWIN